MEKNATITLEEDWVILKGPKAEWDNKSYNYLLRHRCNGALNLSEQIDIGFHPIKRVGKTRCMRCEAMAPDAVVGFFNLCAWITEEKV